MRRGWRSGDDCDDTFKGFYIKLSVFFLFFLFFFFFSCTGSFELK